MFLDLTTYLFPSTFSYSRISSLPGEDDSDDDDVAPVKMGKQLGTFRAVYLVAICCIGYVLTISPARINHPLL